ncbi:MAG: AMP-binding protein [Myxococcaceae bacterium]|nr:AMP-binding protein [Myxococcaceae bacterium]MCI0673858.1 AMP-binding protein [Myxococcaceae bacterium]
MPRLCVLTSDGQDVGDPRERAEALARELRQLGLTPGARVVVALPNGPELVSAFLACVKSGLTFVPLSPLLPAEETQRRLAAVGASALLAAGSPPRLLQARTEAHSSEGERAAVMLFTSGSEGGGRPVALSGPALLHVADTHHRELGYAPGTSITGYLPWSHSFGFVLELLMGLLYQAWLRSVPSDVFPEVVSSAPPQLLFTVPRMLEKLAEGTLQALEGGIVGGAPLRGELRMRLGRTRLRVGYGQTECSPGVTLGRPGEWEHDDFLGRPIGCETLLRQSAEYGYSELLIRGPNLALGYVEEGQLRPLALSDGWLVTGDLASALDGGYVFRGRRDELFKLDNGRMVNPVPLEVPYGGRILLVGAGGRAVVPLARGEIPADFQLSIPHLPARVMSDSFWNECTTPSGKVSRRRAQRLFEGS